MSWTPTSRWESTHFCPSGLSFHYVYLKQERELDAHQQVGPLLSAFPAAPMNASGQRCPPEDLQGLLAQQLCRNRPAVFASRHSACSVPVVCTHYQFAW